jgi:hypothetical protein
MLKLEVAPRRRSARAPQNTAPTAKPRLQRNWDLLAILLLLLGSFPTVWLAHRTVTMVPDLGLIDDNWHLDSTFKALRGIWIGRDVAFTHGPIFQALSAIPARSMPLSLGALYATWNTIPFWCAIFFAYVAVRLLLPTQPPWKRFVLLLLLASFWETSLRSTFPVLLFVLFLRGWYLVQAGRLRSAYAGAGGAVLCVLAFLIAGDVGIYATAAWVICWLAMAVEMRRQRFARQLLIGAAGFAIAGAISLLIVNTFIARPLDFRFWRDSLAQIAAYRWATPAAMTDEGTMHLIAALLICGTIFVMRAFSRGAESLITQHTAFLLGGFVFGLAVLQSAIVRSDIGHVIIGEFPLIFFSGAILFSFEGYASVVAAIAAIALSMLLSHPVIRPSSVLRLYSQLQNPMTNCPAGYSEFDRACYLEALTPQMLNAGSNFLSRNSTREESVFVFPYQTMLGLAAGRNVAGGLMQAYTASGPNLARLEISGLEGKSVPAALYFTDPDYRHMSEAEVKRWSRNYLSVPVDGIPNFTRTPEVWFWMMRHYRMEGQLSPGVVGLLRDDSRASRIQLQAQPLGLPQRSYTISQRSSSTDIGAPNMPASFDFIRLRMTVRYPIWWKLRKPERLQLEITRADGSRAVQWFLAQPNVSNELWFYPWEQPELANYFSADETQWRAAPRSSIVQLRVLATPLDWVSQQPDVITVEAADAVKLKMPAQR